MAFRTKSNLLMKLSSFYIIAAALAAIIMTSCSKEIIETNLSKTITLTSLTATSAPETQDTKTILDGNTLKSSWLAGDAINVFFGASESSKFVCQASGEIAQFKGSIDVVTGGGEGLTDDTSLWGVYPYNSNTSCDGTTITLSLPSNQQAKTDTFADDLFPTIARSQNFYLSFYNVCGSFRFTVTNPGIVKVTVKGNNGENIAGKARVSMNERPEVSTFINPVQEITLSAPDGGSFEVGKTYYFALYPTNFQSGFTLTFYKEDSKAEFIYSSAYNLKRNVFTMLRDKDKGLIFNNIPLNDWGDGENVEGEI
mgnify:CR=1 FL=1